MVANQYTAKHNTFISIAERRSISVHMEFENVFVKLIRICGTLCTNHIAKCIAPQASMKGHQCPLAAYIRFQNLFVILIYICGGTPTQ